MSAQAPAPDGLQAVLIDMDGTVVDSEPYWIASEKRLVAEHGGTWTDEQAYQLVGNELIESGRVIREQAGLPISAEAIVERMVDDVATDLRRDPPWRPGARELLAGLSERAVPVALVTMSYRSLTDAVVAALPAGTFATIVAGDDVQRGKPDPEPYLTAAARLGADPARCVAIEDSNTGVRSAEAAGCVVIAVPHHVPIAAAPGRVLVDSLAALDVDGLAGLVAARAGTGA